MDSDSDKDESKGSEEGETPNDVLSQTGVEDEGIVNFLSDAIGLDIEKELLREFSQSHEFAELFDDLIPSLAPIASGSRRVSHSSSGEELESESMPVKAKEQELSVLTDDMKININSKTDDKASKLLDKTGPGRKKQNPLMSDGSKRKFSNATRNKIKSVQDSVSPDRDTVHDRELEKTPSNCQKIQNRLKICFKPSGNTKEQRRFKEPMNCKKSNEEAKPKRRVNKKKVESMSSRPKLTGLDTSESDEPYEASDRSDQTVHKKCEQIHSAKDFVYFQTKFNLDPCCVILCDLLHLGNDFKDTNCLGGGGDPSLSFVTMKKVVTISNAKVDSIHKTEKLKRLQLANKLCQKKLRTDYIAKKKSISTPLHTKSKKHLRHTRDQVTTEIIGMAGNSKLNTAYEEPPPVLEESALAKERLHNVINTETDVLVAKLKREHEVITPETEVTTSKREDTHKLTPSKRKKSTSNIDEIHEVTSPEPKALISKLEDPHEVIVIPSDPKASTSKLEGAQELNVQNSKSSTSKLENIPEVKDTSPDPKSSTSKLEDANEVILPNLNSSFELENTHEVGLPDSKSPTSKLEDIPEVKITPPDSKASTSQLQLEDTHEVKVTPADLTESTSKLEDNNAVKVTPADLTESTSKLEDKNAIKVTPASLTESTSKLEDNNAVKVTPAGLTESTSKLEDNNAVKVTPADLTESTSKLEDNNAVKVTPADSTESTSKILGANEVKATSAEPKESTSKLEDTNEVKVTPADFQELTSKLTDTNEVKVTPGELKESMSKLDDTNEVIVSLPDVPESESKLEEAHELVTSETLENEASKIEEIKLRGTLKDIAPEPKMSKPVDVHSAGNAYEVPPQKSNRTKLLLSAIDSSTSSSSSDQDDDDQILRPRKVNKARDVGQKGDGEATSFHGLDSKNVKFGKKHDKTDSRAKKFDKLEDERQRKFSDKQKEKQMKTKFNPDEQFMERKSFPNTFRIPKKNNYLSHGTTSDNLKVSTPLEKQEIPSVNLKFERCKKGKEDRDTNEPRFKRKDWISTRKKRPENESKKDFKPERVEPISEVKPIPEPTWEDNEHEGCADEGEGDEGSYVGGRSTDSPLPPLSEVLVGELAVEVNEFLRDGSVVELPSLTDFSCPTDATAQKCAWWFNKTKNDPPPDEDSQMQDLEDVPSSYGSDCGSDKSFAGNVSNPEADDDCQVNEISSTNYGHDGGYGTARDPDKVDEYCGRSLLQAKIRSGTGENFQNIFDLRSGALYEKENFQAKCNLCNQLIVGRRDLAVHVRGISHKEKLRRIDMEVSNTDEGTSHAEKAKLSHDSKNDADKNEEKNVGIRKEKDKKEKEKISKDGKVKRSPSESPKKNGKKEAEKDKPISIKKEQIDIKKEPVEMERGRTSTGLSIKVPVVAGSSKRRSKSPVNRRRSRSRSRHRSRTRSRSRERRRRRSRSPIRRIPRSPKEHLQRLGSRRSRSPRRRSRSRSPRHISSRKRRSSSEERVKEFLARTKRSKSPANGYHSKRGRRTRSRSPQISIKKDNRGFHEKLALTAEGKWTEEMEQRWKLMEAEEAMFREQFYDRRKLFISSPEEHPKYGDEWTQFWERRYQEVEKSGKDPEAYDYISEWKEFWAKRLNGLLQEEADAKIREIKKKYEMDFESLSKLRKVEAKPILKSEPMEKQIWPNSAVLTSNANETPRSISDRASLADFSGISDGDNDFIKMKEISSKARAEQQRKSSVTVEDFKSTWEALTRPKTDTEVSASLTDGLKIIAPSKEMSKMLKSDESVVRQRNARLNRQSANRSDVASSSDASYDFDGFDLVQVLRLMCKCEDQLSFLAPKVLEYFRAAEEMELKKSRGSHTLLDNEEFVSVLFQARDRFMTMIRSNILSKDVLKSLNLTVYALNAILDAPQCQKFRPQLPVTLPELETPAVPIHTETNQVVRQPVDTVTKIKKPDAGSDLTQQGITITFSNISMENKVAISAVVAQYLVSVGRESISNLELKAFLEKFLMPLVSKISGAKKPAEDDSLSDISGEEEVKPDYTESMPEFAPTTVLKNELDTHSVSARLYGVTSSRVVGSALPTLPTGSYRTRADDSIRVPASYVEHNSNESRNSRSRNNSGGGRTSPFSCRDYSGNPLANTGRL